MRSGDVVAGRFTLEKLAGAGGMGVIYRATDGHTGAAVALKILHAKGPVERARFAREARVLSELQHPGIVRYIDQGLTAVGEPYLAMEWLDGEDLSERLSLSRLSIEETVTLGRRVAEALAVAHARGVVHGDIKPSNLFLSRSSIESVKVLDFGIARMETGPRVFLLSSSGRMLGTPAYMAPEQARGDRHLDARADVFALGCVLFECLTGRKPFEGSHPLAVLAKILLEEPPRVEELLSEVPEALCALLSRMLYKDIAGRPADGARVAAELSNAGAFGRASRPSISLSPPPMSSSEEGLLSVIVAGADPATQPADEEATPRAGVVEEPLLAAALRFSARMEHLADGSSVALLAGHGSATSLAAQAARCALAMRAALPRAPMVLALSSGVAGERLPVGAAIDRAVALLHIAPPEGRDKASPSSAAPATPPSARRRTAPIYLDEVTAELIDARFETTVEQGERKLWGERETQDGAMRTLLGRPTPFVGRDRDLSMLEATFEECVAESASHAVLVTGAAGVGKSRVRYEFLRSLRNRSAKADEPGVRGRALPPEPRRAREQAPPVKPLVEIWIARGDPLHAGAPFGLLAELVRRTAGLFEGEPVPLQRDKLRARLERSVPAELAPRVTVFLGELVGASFPDDESVELMAARRDAMLMGDQVRRAWEDFVRAECAAHPLVIVLEDLHWGDSPSVHCVDAMLENLGDRPLMVLAIGRPEVHDRFPRLWADRRTLEIHLRELPRRAGARLIRQFLGERAAMAMEEQLLNHSEGNAFYLEELIRAAAESRGEPRLPGMIPLVQARLATFSPDAQRALRAASVFGLAFWAGGVRALLGEERGAVNEQLEDLLQREVIVARRSTKFFGEEEFVFHHDAVRDAAYALLPEGEKRTFHRLAGAWLEQVGEMDARALSEHLTRGGAAERAASLYLSLSEQALTGHDFSTSIEHASRGVECGAEGETLGALLLVQAEANRYLGRNADAEVSAVDALKQLSKGCPRWFSAVAELGFASGRVGKFDRLAPLAQELFRIELRGAPGPYVIAAARVGLQLFMAGQVELGDRLLATAAAAAAHAPRPDPVMVAFVARSRAVRSMLAGDLSGFVVAMTEAAASFERAGAERSAVGQQANVAHAYLSLGAYGEAEGVLRDVLARASRMGLSDLAAGMQHNLALAVARRGALDEALALLASALDAATAQRSRRLEVLCRTYRSIVLLLGQDAEGAEREARAALEIPDVPPPTRAYPLGALCRALLARGNETSALDASEKAMALLASPAGIEESEFPVYVAHIEALLANDLLKEAEEAVSAARERLLSRAARISDLSFRESFLGSVPDNARILELARAYLRDPPLRRASSPPSPPEARPSRPPQSRPSRPPDTRPSLPPPEGRRSRPPDTRPSLPPPEGRLSRPLDARSSFPASEARSSRPLGARPSAPPETRPSGPSGPRSSGPPETRPSASPETRPSRSSEDRPSPLTPTHPSFPSKVAQAPPPSSRKRDRR